MSGRHFRWKDGTVRSSLPSRSLVILPGKLSGGPLSLAEASDLPRYFHNSVPRFLPKAPSMSNDEPEPPNRPANVADFLLRVMGELGTKIGAIWMGADGQLVPVVAVGLEDSQLFDGEDGKRFLRQALSDTLTQSKAQSFDTEGLIEPRAF